MLFRSNEGVTTRKNLVIQALGQDMLDLLQTDMQRRIEENGIDATLCFDRHDEMFWDVDTDYAETLKSMLQDSHQFVMSCLLLRLGFEGVADWATKWMSFSSVEILDNYAGKTNIVTTPW